MAAPNPIRHVRGLDRYEAGSYVIYAFAFPFFLFPVLWPVSMSLRPAGEVVSYPLELIPSVITVDAYQRVIQRSNMLI